MKAHSPWTTDTSGTFFGDIYIGHPGKSYIFHATGNCLCVFNMLVFKSACRFDFPSACLGLLPVFVSLHSFLPAYFLLELMSICGCSDSEKKFALLYRIAQRAAITVSTSTNMALILLCR